MMIQLPVFTELYAVSDIHLGGEITATSNFQIFNRGPRLAGFIDYVADQRPDENIALVLNGDIIDSLAEDVVPGYVALDEATASKMIERIWTDPSFAMVWNALVKFLEKPRRHLVIILGNHDIELALPVVETDLRNRLTANISNPQSKLDAQSRLLFSTHGGGYACMVGRARVFCTHGNEVDLMNWVDYSLLGQLANAIAAGRNVESKKWKPNAGTRLVVDVMNIVKKTYPFVDLLKPETAAIAGVLMALDHETFKKVDLADAFPILKDALKGRSITSELLNNPIGVDGVSPKIVADEVLQQLAGPNLRDALKRSASKSTSSVDDLLISAGTAMNAGVRPSVKMGNTNGVTETLSAWDYISGWIGILDKPEALRLALQDWLVDDNTYNITDASQDGGLYKDMQGRVSNGIDFTITGHTHLARALRFSNGSGYYNCGTWIRLLRLTSEVLASEEAFKKELWSVLNKRSMEALDEAEIPGPNGTKVKLLLDQTNAVRISFNGNQTIGDLLRVSEDEQSKKLIVNVQKDHSGNPIPSIIAA